MINMEYVIVHMFGEFIPIGLDGVDVLVWIMFAGISIFFLFKLLTNNKYENTLIVKLINKIC